MAKRKKIVRIEDMGKPSEQLVNIEPEDLMSLPYLQSSDSKSPPIKPLTEDQKKRYECSLDGVSAVGLPRLKSSEEEERAVKDFLSGLKKLLSRKDNWTFLQPLMLSLENCVKCNTCSESCPIYVASGRQEIYRPTYRTEVLRKIINKYLK